MEQPIGDYYPAGTSKHDIEDWLATLSEPDRKRALDPFTVIEGAPGGPASVPGALERS